MDPLSELYKRAEKLRSQIPKEKDPVLRREMVKTFKSHMKEIRSASHRTSPEKMFFLLVLFLVSIVGSAVYGVASLEHVYGWGGTVTPVVLVIGAMIVLTAMVFLVMKIITPQTYKELVRSGTDLIKWLRPGASHPTAEEPNSLPAPKSAGGPAPALPVPTVSFDDYHDDSAHGEDDFPLTVPQIVFDVNASERPPSSGPKSTDER